MKVKMKLAKNTKNFYRYEATTMIGNLYIPRVTTPNPPPEIEFDIPIPEVTNQ